MAVTDLTTNTVYATIQAAVNGANPGDTLLADPGTYNESVTINKPLTLLGAQHGVDARTRSGAESIISGASGDTPLNVTASNVVVDGFTIEGATNPNIFGAGIEIAAGTSGTQILDNIVQDNIAGLNLAASGVAQTVISQNLFQNNNEPGPESGIAIYSDQFVAGGSLSDVSITDNEFSDNDEAGVELSSTDNTKIASGITIQGNDFSNESSAGGHAIFLLDASNVTVSENTSAGSTGAAIFLDGGDSNVEITQNQIVSSQAQGVQVANDLGVGLSANSNVTVIDNSLANTTGPGLEVDAGGLAAGQTVEASGNWWGSANLGDAENNISGSNYISLNGIRTTGVDADPATAGFQPAAPQLLIVTTLADENDPGASQNNPGGTGLSLREALTIANADPDTYLIEFDPSLAHGTITLTNGELDIASNVTIEGDINGNGTPDIGIYAGGNSRVFEVSSGTATLDGLFLTGGYSPTVGGGIYVDSGATLTVTNSTLYGNSAGGYGGGIDNLGTLTLTNSTLYGNSATLAGGGIGSDGTLAVVNSTLTGNTTSGGGGGIAENGALTLTNATLSGNSAFNGGAVAAYSGTLTLYDGTLTGNSASNVGGGIYGGNSASATLVNSIVAGNAATSGYDVYGTNSLVLEGGNILGSAPSSFSSVTGSYTPIDGTSQTGLQSVFAQVGYDPNTHVLSGQLADNSGLVPTVALNPTGIAIDAGVTADLPPDTFDLNNNANTAEPLPVDARGFARVAGASVDLGAFEQQAGQSFVVTTLNDELDSTNPNATLADEDGGTGLSLREALFLANEDPTTADTISFASNLSGGTIDLTLGQLKLSGGVTIDGDINGDTTPDITVDAEGSSRVFDAVYGTSTLNGLTITGGYANHGGGVSVGTTGSYAPANLTISNSVITNNQAAYGGGLAVNYGATLQVADTTVSGNYGYLVGGGIANQGTLTLTNSTVSNNDSGYIGGGIASDNILTVTNSSLLNNQTGAAGAGLPAGYQYGGGGGLYNSGSAALLNTTIAGNNGGYGGGGIYNSEQLALTNVTIADNSAYNGGGLSNAACGCGTITIYDTTITGNAATQSGGGIYNANGSVTLTNSIVAGNGASYQGPDIAASGYATTTYAGVNLFSQAGIGRSGIDIYQPNVSKIFASLTTIDPDGVPNSGDEFQAGTLANNGGPVETVQIKQGGNAQDTGDNGAVPAGLNDDARGFARVIDGTVDIGAVELEPTTLTSVTGTTAEALQGGAAVTLLTGTPIATTDPGLPDLAGATVQITNFQPGDTLAVNTGGTAISVASNTNGTLTLTGADTLTDYENVLATVTYQDAGSDTATVGHPTRTIAWTVTNGLASSTAVDTTLTIDRPPTQATHSVNVDENASTGTVGAGDSDPDNDSITVTGVTGGTVGAPLAGTYGTLTLNANDTFSYTANNLAAIIAVPPGNPTDSFTYTVSDGHGGTATETLNVVIQRSHTVDDYNADLMSDVLWRNSDGSLAVWLMNGSAITAGANPTYQGSVITPSTSWSMVGAGDFNNDGRADVLWQFADGSLADWTMNGATISSSDFVRYQGQVVAPDSSWSIAGTGDFNGDGNADVLWRQSTTGSLAEWQMNGSTITSSGNLFYQGSALAPDSSWSIAGIGDFNGDGDADILWRQSTTGALVDWTMNGSTIAATDYLGVQGQMVAPDSSWSIAGIGDFNGDGDADILWRQSTTGSLAIWLMNGSTIASSSIVTSNGSPVTPNSTWNVVEVGDFNGGNTAGILWQQSTTGTLVEWQMNGAQIASSQFVTSAGTPITPASTWQVQARPTDFA